MSSLERLPPDQRAVLALVLQRGRSYDDIADLLAIDRAAVRDRALAALDALGPSEPQVPAAQRALITDYLLGQLPEGVRIHVHSRLATSASERAWARVLAGELAPLASRPMPEIPAAKAPPPVPPTAPVLAAEPIAHASEPTVPAPEPFYEPEPEPEPVPAPARAGARTRASAAPPASAASAASATPSASAPARSDQPTERIPAPTPASRPSDRRSGAVLLGLALLIVVAAVIVIVATSGGSGPKKRATHTSSTAPATTGTSTTTTTTKTTTHIIARLLLRPVHRGSKAIGAADIVTQGSITGVLVGAEHLAPNTHHNAYAVWLSNPGGGPSHLLGYVNPGVGKTGKLQTSGQLPSNASSYKELLITLETTTGSTPGPIVLEGALSLH